MATEMKVLRCKGIHWLLSTKSLQLSPKVAISMKRHWIEWTNSIVSQKTPVRHIFEDHDHWMSLVAWLAMKIWLLTILPSVSILYCYSGDAIRNLVPHNYKYTNSHCLVRCLIGQVALSFAKSSLNQCGPTIIVHQIMLPNVSKAKHKTSLSLYSVHDFVLNM